MAACGRLIYFPQPLSAREAEGVRLRHPRARELALTAGDGVRLHGWLAPADLGASHGRVIYLGGNAEEVSWMLEFAGAFSGWDLVLVDYRGYGLSEGTPSESDLLRDVLAVYDHLATARAESGGRVVALGRSLGAAVAVHLASRRPLDGVILVAPFDSVAAVARDAFPFLPVSWLLGNPYDSAAIAPSITTPMRMVLAGRDEVIAPERSRRLLEAWGGPKQAVTVAGAGHNDLQGYPAYWQAIREFLAAAAR
jgi:hypothetical protein